MIFGSMRDKDYRVMGELLFPLARHVVLTGIDNQRAADPAEIAAALPEFQSSFTTVPNSGMALQLARQLTSKDETIVVVGSLFLVGEIRRQVIGNRG
jgi:folylpolyglutamate synthase/dihydropteroate synthase